jgi:hypothetical protein
MMLQEPALAPVLRFSVVLGFAAQELGRFALYSVRAGSGAAWVQRLSAEVREHS